MPKVGETLDAHGFEKALGGKVIINYKISSIGSKSSHHSS